ncbi:MAG TPA: GNAT family N-acetyltransferase [Candidatus Limnocylindrales bacterium]|nr:GNAT family N-acetyltransferase [Candidatus Limnocylindrales bacterium]
MNVPRTDRSAAAAQVVVRAMRADDLEAAARIMKLAFGTFLGMPDPAAFGGDTDFVTSRWKADPSRAFVLEVDGVVAGSNLATRWGSFGFFGPLSIDPVHWNKGLSPRLLEPVLERFSVWGCRHTGLYTFAHSPKHHALYQRFGFHPRFLTPIFARAAVVSAEEPAPSYLRFSSLPAHEQESALAGCRAITDATEGGLDVTCEIQAVLAHALGETILLTDDAGVAAFAVCHHGPGTEAGTGFCYVKFAAARPGPGGGPRLDSLLSACEAYARDTGIEIVAAGVNTARTEAHDLIRRRGYRAQIVGVAMQRPNAPAFNRSGAFILDDWR